MEEGPMKIFDYARKHPQEILAVTDEGEEILYGELNKLSIELGKIVGHRLVFVLCRNTPGSLLGYLGLLESGGVPLLLDADIAPALLEDLVQTYRPVFCLFPEDLPRESRQVCLLQSEALQIRDYCLVRSVQQKDRQETAPAPELRLLLTTSGSTGSREAGEDQRGQSRCQHSFDHRVSEDHEGGQADHGPSHAVFLRDVYHQYACDGRR